MALTPDFSVFTEVFTETWTFGTEWLIPLALAIVSMALITKDIQKWKVLFFPIIVLLRIIGIPVHFLIIIIAGVLFVVEALSTQVVGDLIGTAKKWSKGEVDYTGTDRQFRKATKLLAKAKKQELKIGAIRKAKGSGLMPTGITKAIQKSQRKARRKAWLEEQRRRLGL